MKSVKPQPQPIGFPSREAWRSWLIENHDRVSELWVAFDKVHTGKPTLRYDEAVEEAVCYGWIDGLRKRLDAERFLQKFTPRRKATSWSEANLKRAKRMIAAGKMTPVGLDRLGNALREYEAHGVAHRPPRLDEPPREMAALLKRNRAARLGFERLAPSHRRQYLGWIVSAKKDETRQRRIKEVLAILAAGKPLGLK